MSTITTVVPIRKLTVMVDACVYRSSPDTGDQLAAMMALLKKKGVECQFLQNRFSLMEATNNSHELILGDDKQKIYQMEFGGIKESARAHKYPPPEYIQNYLSFIGSVQNVVPVTYYDAPGSEVVFNERAALTRKHLFGDERFKKWPEVRRELLDKKLRSEDLDDYYASLLSVCSQCAHGIEGIHHLMKQEPGLHAKLPQDVKKNFMLDHFRQGRPVFWEQINLSAMDPNNIPIPVIDSFGKSRLMLKLFGKHDKQERHPGETHYCLGQYDHHTGLTPLGKLLMQRQMDLGEKIMMQEASAILKADKDHSHVVLLLTDDGNGLKRFAHLEKEHSNCTAITSREMATLAVGMCNLKGMQKHFPQRAVQKARDISQGIIASHSPSARSAEYIMSGDTTFAERVAATVKTPKDVHERN